MLLVSLALVACGSSSDGEAETSGNDTETSTGDSESEESVTLRLGHVASEDSYFHIPAAHFADLVKEKTDGSVEIDIYSGAQLGGDRDMLENTRNGSQDMGWISLAVFDGITPNFNGIQLPFLLTDRKVANEFFDSDLANEMLGTLEEKNIKGVALVEGDLRQWG